MYTKKEIAEKLSEREFSLPYGLIETEYEEIISYLQKKGKISKTKNLKILTKKGFLKKRKPF